MKVRSQLHDPDFLAGIVTADSVRVAETPPELHQRLQELVRTRATEDFPPAGIKEAVRVLLRRGGFQAVCGIAPGTGLSPARQSRDAFGKRGQPFGSSGAGPRFGPALA